MTVLHLSGRITPAGTLEVRLPRNLPPGEARVTLELPEETLQKDEIQELLRVDPRTGKEIAGSGLTGGWTDQGIADGQAWVRKQRERRKKQRSW